MKPKIILEDNIALDCANMVRKRFSIFKMILWKMIFLIVMFFNRFVYKEQETKNKETNRIFVDYYNYIDSEFNIMSREMTSLQNYMSSTKELKEDVEEKDE